MKTDTIFYQLFQTFPSLLFELIGQSTELAQGYQFLSQEVKELARRFDGVFLPPANIKDKPIYFVEVQFQPKSDFYWRFFTEIFVYLGEYQPEQDWCAVAVFSSRNLDPGIPRQYRGLLASKQVKVVYLDELEASPQSSLGLGIVQLIVKTEDEATSAVEPFNKLMQKTREDVEDLAFRQKVLELMETVLVYKFTTLSRKELEAMFGLDELKQTRYFQDVAAENKLEGKLEGKLESVPGFLALGLSVEQIAQALKLEVDVVRKAAEEATAENSEDENI
ncbi:MAG: Rpn family recombination-promoting nuclease/putative transposase [Moorea sp. SIO2B7]|nr:Rpn family recombination-promoting nuclease/putative transposase [Moorena sp. SIO2B7]